MRAMAELKIGDFVEFLGADECFQSSSTPLPQSWFLLRVHPGKEFKIRRAFEKRGVSFYMPTFVKRQGVGRRNSAGGYQSYANRSLPLFPGLVFMPDFDADIDRLRTFDGVTSFLKFGDKPAMMHSRMMAALRNLEAELAVPPAKRRRLYEVGQIVRIAGGPFDMWTGRIERLDPNGRLRVLLDAVKREMPVVVAEHQVEPV